MRHPVQSNSCFCMLQVWDWGAAALRGREGAEGCEHNAGVDLWRTGVVAVLEGLLGALENSEGACCLERRLSCLSTCFITFSVSFIRACTPKRFVTHPARQHIHVRPQPSAAEHSAKPCVLIALQCRGQAHNSSMSSFIQPAGNQLTVVVL